MVLAHTPFRRLAAEGRLRDLPVLVAGVGHPADVARHYGFQQVRRGEMPQRFTERHSWMQELNVLAQLWLPDILLGKGPAANTYVMTNRPSHASSEGVSVRYSKETRFVS